MIAAKFLVPARNRFEQLFDALVDPARCERTMMLMLTGYAATWSVYAAIAKSTQDIHPDMGEIVAWSREVGLGTPKHPPLGAWLVRAWFGVFPREDWAFYLFAMILPTVALWVTWRISARYLPRDKRVVGIALLTLVPFYNFHALKFNANSVLTPFWAATTWWLLRSFETHRAGWAVLAGIGAAAAMLGKYWSVIMLAGLGLAALTDPRRDAYFGSPAPYLTLAVGTILLTPHVDWLIANQFEPFTYAMKAHPATLLMATGSALGFVGSSLCYVAAPIILSLFAVRPSMTAVGDTLRPADPDRRALVIAFAGPFLLAVLIAVMLRVKIESLWAMSAMTLFPIVLLSSPLVTIPRPVAIPLVALSIAFPLVMVTVSPVVGLITAFTDVPNYATQYQLVARAVERAWHENTDQPLRIVGGEGDLLNGIPFYFVKQPSNFDINRPGQTPWVDDPRIWREGMAIVCPELRHRCLKAMNIWAALFPSAKFEDVTLATRYFRMRGTPVRYQIVIIPPQTQ